MTAFAASPHMGTWKLNEAKSKFSPGATKNHTVTYTEAKDGMIKLTVEGMDKDGKPFSRMNGFVPELFVDQLSERIWEALGS